MLDNPILLISLGSLLLFVAVTVVAYVRTRRGGLLLILTGVVLWPIFYIPILFYVWFRVVAGGDGFNTPPQALVRLGSMFGVLILIEAVRRLGLRPHA